MHIIICKIKEKSNYNLSFNALSVSLFISLSLIDSFLSKVCLPLATPISSLALPPLKYNLSGTMVNPLIEILPFSFNISSL